MVKSISNKVKKSDKYIFSLIGVNTEKVNQMYGISLVSNICNQSEQPNTTKIVDLVVEKTSHGIISFIDETKHLRKCNVSIGNVW